MLHAFCRLDPDFGNVNERCWIASIYLPSRAQPKSICPAAVRHLAEHQCLWHPNRPMSFACLPVTLKED